ncbi:alpha/beta hydrolase [Caviibacter abscessus]|uniref:alpha/beta hydrolase n=1 Tax=Caviibacter abscessus TaxID=1766719 RepID=UPI000830642F|nr:alpha/beta hydrolase [Caviibacter abscessus]
MKKTLKIFGVISILSLLSLGLVSNYFYNFALNAKTNKSKITNQDDDDTVNTRKKDDMKWFEQNKIEINSVSITKNKLTGYKFINKKSNKWIIVVHGYANRAINMSTYIKQFYDRGYNILAVDLIAHGKSEGNTYSMGGFDSYDIINWSKLISKEYNNPDIILFGISMGATTIMNSVIKNDLPKNVIAFIEDSGYINLREQFSFQLKKLYHLPSFPIIPTTNLITKIRAGYYFEDISVRNGLKNVTIPALILHGDADTFVPIKNAYEIFNSLKSNKKIHVFKGTKHVKAESKFRNEYWEQIDNFLSNL